MSTVYPNAKSNPPPGSLRQVMRRHPLAFYFLMAYTFSWIMVLPYILSVWGLLPKYFILAFYLNPFVGPFLAAFIMTRIVDGKAGSQRLLRRFLIWRVDWRWYLLILLGIPALVLLGALVLPGAATSFHGVTPTFPLIYLANFVLIIFIGGPLGEEPGWRGFALPRMQVRYGPLRGTLLLGFLWACWHLPHFLTPAQGGGPGTSFATFLVNFPVFVVATISAAVIFTWVFNHTRESLLIVILLHASLDGSSALLPLFAAPIVSTGSWVLLPEILTAVLIIALTRGRLGYRQVSGPSRSSASDSRPPAWLPSASAAASDNACGTRRSVEKP